MERSEIFLKTNVLLPAIEHIRSILNEIFIGEKFSLVMFGFPSELDGNPERKDLHGQSWYVTVDRNHPLRTGSLCQFVGVMIDPCSGADPGFSFGGGGGRKKIMFPHAMITSAEPNSLSAGVQDPLKGPGSSKVVFMLSRAIRALFLRILIFFKEEKKAIQF